MIDAAKRHANAIVPADVIVTRCREGASSYRAAKLSAAKAKRAASRARADADYAVRCKLLLPQGRSAL